MTFPVFKAGDSSLSGSNGGFDFHTPPPYFRSYYAGTGDLLSVAQRWFSGLLHKIGATVPAGLAFPSSTDGVFHRFLTLENPFGIVLPHDFFRVSKYGCDETSRDAFH